MNTFDSLRSLSMTGSRSFLFLFFIFVGTTEITGMIDNKFLPLYRPEYTRYENKRSVFSSNVFFLFSIGGRSFDECNVNVPEITGKYDLIKISQALTATGKPDPLSAQWRSLTRIPWELQGGIEGAGFWFGWEQAFKNLSVGLSLYALKVISKQYFVLPESTIKEMRVGKGGETILRQEQLNANKLLGIESLQFSRFGLADIDLYFKLGTVKEYFHKFRKIDLSATLGMLIPTGNKVDINIPASIPFGGNKHFGLYGRTDVILDLRDDIVVGFWLEFCKRFAKNDCVRLPIKGEPLEYGALTTQVNVNPGLTVGFKPWIAFTDIQDGLGFKVGYTLVHHDEDQITDLRKEKIIPVPINDLIERSGWVNQYVNFRVMYDLSKAVHNRKFTPILYFDWDMPIGLFTTRNISRTNRLSLGFEYDF